MEQNSNYVTLKDLITNFQQQLTNLNALQNTVAQRREIEEYYERSIHTLEAKKDKVLSQFGKLSAQHEEKLHVQRMKLQKYIQDCNQILVTGSALYANNTTVAEYIWQGAHNLAQPIILLESDAVTKFEYKQVATGELELQESLAKNAKLQHDLSIINTKFYEVQTQYTTILEELQEAKALIAQLKMSSTQPGVPSLSPKTQHDTRNNGQEYQQSNGHQQAAKTMSESSETALVQANSEVARLSGQLHHISASLAITEKFNLQLTAKYNLYKDRLHQIEAPYNVRVLCYPQLSKITSNMIAILNEEGRNSVPRLNFTVENNHYNFSQYFAKRPKLAVALFDTNLRSHDFSEFLDFVEFGNVMVMVLHNRLSGRRTTAQPVLSSFGTGAEVYFEDDKWQENEGNRASVKCFIGSAAKAFPVQ